VVITPVVAKELSLSCARLTAGRVTTSYQSTSMANSASHPSGVGEMSSNPLMMKIRMYGPYRCQLLPVQVVGPPHGACVCRLWAVAALISDESALEVR